MREKSTCVMSSADTSGARWGVNSDTRDRMPEPAADTAGGALTDATEASGFCQGQQSNAR